jgi:predicted Zn-dependent protease
MAMNMKKTEMVAVGIVVLLLALPGVGLAQGQNEKADRDKTSADVDRQAKHLFDKAMELMEYKQYERGLAMLNTVVRDNQGNILSHRANMAMGKHFLDQNKPKEALNYFMLLSRVLTPVPGQKQNEELEELYHEALFQAGFSQYQAGQYRDEPLQLEKLEQGH